jgi:AraC-like DNA-binding protein
VAALSGLPSGAEGGAGVAHAQSAALLCLRESFGALDRGKPLSLTQRAASLGPLTVIDLGFGQDSRARCVRQRPYYQINVPAAGQIDIMHEGSRMAVVPGSAHVCLPEGEFVVPRCAAGSRMLAVRIDRDAVEDALSEATGRQVPTQVAFEPMIVTAKGAARTWMHLLTVLARDVFRPDTTVTQPLVAAPFVEGVIQAFLLATDHPHRELLSSQTRFVAPQAIRPAVDIIETEPHLPHSVVSLARRCGIGSRALQQGFARHLGMSPMMYLRQVRLRRAHQNLLTADPSVETVASVAKRWGFNNPGRFAAAHAARYGETPAATIRRWEQATPNHRPRSFP